MQQFFLPPGKHLNNDFLKTSEVTENLARVHFVQVSVLRPDGQGLGLGFET